MPTETFYSHGKLLLTADYVVLDTADALGLPTKFGQKLEVETTAEASTVNWKSYLHNQEIWLNFQLI
jgi:hypothetical protein